jgi:ubiquinone/menaquinone biosynthesis C-methylase UbiE
VAESGGVDMQAAATRVAVYEYLEDVSDRGVTDLNAWVVEHASWPEGAVALDVGCGPGPYLATLQQRAARVVAADLSTGMLTEARDRVSGSGCRFVAADAQQLPLVSECVDVIVAGHMLYHVPDIALAVREFRRVLKPGGTLLVVLNGPVDKAEIRQLWQQCCADIMGSGFRLANWGERANLDNASDLLSTHFEIVAVDRLPGTFRVPSAEPVLAWIDSHRSGTERWLSDEQWTAIARLARSKVEDIIATDGAFRASKESGVVVAR